MEKNKRYKVLDIIRGFTLIEMIVYHGLWDLVYVFGYDFPWYKGKMAYIWQQSICCTFIFLSGFCWSMGRKKIERGCKVFLGGLVITLVTLLIMPNERVVFGVLTLLGSCMLLMIPLEKILQNVKGKLGIAISILLFIAFRNVNRGYLGFEEWNFLELPKGLYQNYITAFLGFPEKDFYSTDYFSIIPWMFLFITGYFLYQEIQQKEKLNVLTVEVNIPILEWFGRNSLCIYMLHQPVVYCLIMIFESI